MNKEREDPILDACLEELLSGNRAVNATYDLSVGEPFYRRAGYSWHWKLDLVIERNLRRRGIRFVGLLQKW